MFITLFINTAINAQVTFAEDCFVGGVQAGGHRTIGALLGASFNIKWDDGYSLRRAYALCYRYGRPEPHTFYVNDGGITWNMGNQAGPEMVEENNASNFFAAHAVDITDAIVIDNNVVNIDLPQQTFYDFAWNWGWWGAYIVLYYESPDITTEVCTRIYVADQSQDFPQNYSFEKPFFDTDKPLLFSIFSDRLTSFESDASAVSINSELLGNIWSPDLLNPISSAGVQGHFFYENGIAEGLNGDTANTRVHQHDGIAVINEYLTDDEEQNLNLTPVSWPNIGFNPHPAFLLTYTPDCEVAAEDMPRQYTFCRGDSVQFAALSGYENYAWSSAEFLSDSSVANPWCVADSSRWYTVRMWSDDGDICPQTIPVHVEVRQTPRARNVFTRSSSCPNPTGEVRFEEMSGTPPFQYTVNGNTQSNPAFTPIGAGVYDISVEDDLGCTWDSTANVIYNPIHEAAFSANPDSGFSPLSVFFDNQSINTSGSYWQINGQDISESENLNYVFEEPGTYEVMLIAWRIEETCTDTATVFIYVDQGLEIVVPNIITPNGDGQNDALVAELRGVASLRWQIYDRWGNVVHGNEAALPVQSIELWNPAGDANTGQYFIVLTAFGENGKTREVKAAVTVTR
ncbi:MAG: gliding motility-associated C-terminal domain-containing protein [Cryomorphaceae bacterium]|nr:gliding motility-associated C-terminal domain-containing protein [Flavobacteriales bacterium]